jgi:hypothetical protein
LGKLNSTVSSISNLVGYCMLKMGTTHSTTVVILEGQTTTRFWFFSSWSFSGGLTDASTPRPVLLTEWY